MKASIPMLASSYMSRKHGALLSKQAAVYELIESLRDMIKDWDSIDAPAIVQALQDTLEREQRLYADIHEELMTIEKKMACFHAALTDKKPHSTYREEADEDDPADS